MLKFQLQNGAAGHYEVSGKPGRAKLLRKIQECHFMLLLIRSGLPLMMHLTRAEFLGNDYACEIVEVGDVQLKF